MKKITTLILLSMGLLASQAQAHSKAFTPSFVQTLVAPYLAIQAGLAGDDFSAAQKGAADYLKAMAHAPSGEAEQSAVATLRDSAQAIASAKDIDAARAAFLTLSKSVEPLVSHVGITGKEKLYVAHCPMAFGGKGANWIQSEKSVSNPYYGASMLRCGSVKKQISGEKEAAHEQGHDEHSGHKH